MKKADRLLHSAEAMCRLLHRKRATGDRSGRQKPKWVCDFPPTEGFCSQLVGETSAVGWCGGQERGHLLVTSEQGGLGLAIPQPRYESSKLQLKRRLDRRCNQNDCGCSYLIIGPALTSKCNGR